MKKIIVIGSAIMMAMLILNGCYYDEVITYEGLPQNVSFKNDVQPIFTQNCAATNCHDATPAHQPSLVSQNSYNALVNGGYVNLTDPSNSVIYKIVEGGEMPPSGPLSINDQKLILGWITEGAKNN